MFGKRMYDDFKIPALSDNPKIFSLHYGNTERFEKDGTMM